MNLRSARLVLTKVTPVGSTARVSVTVVVGKQQAQNLRRLFEGLDEFDLTVATTAAEAASDRSNPAVVVVDLRSLDMGASALTALVRAAAPAQVVILARSLDDARLAAPTAGGAPVRCLVDDVRPAELVDTVRAAAASNADRRGNRELTARERDIVALLDGGLSNRQIARRLGIAESTVKAHLTRAYRALGVTSRTEAGDWSRGTLTRR